MSWFQAKMSQFRDIGFSELQYDAGTKGDTSFEALVEVEIETLWGVDLYNDEIHTFEEVIRQLIKAISCTQGRAEDLAWTVHNEGLAHVFDGKFDECLRVSGVLHEIGLLTQIRG